MPVKKGDFGAALFLLVLSVGAGIMAFRLGLGGIHNPGPGLIPFGTAGLLGIMSIGLLLKNLPTSQTRREAGIFRGVQWGTLILVLSSLLVYAMVLNLLGFTIATFLLMVLLLKGIGGQKLWRSLALAALIVIGNHLIFVFWLGCLFPKGFLKI
jgi:hypothetical protein